MGQVCISVNVIGVFFAADLFYRFEGVKAVNRLQTCSAAERTYLLCSTAYNVAVYHIIGDELALVVVARKAAGIAFFTAAVGGVGRFAAVNIIAVGDALNGAAVNSCAVTLNQVNNNIGVAAAESVLCAGKRYGRITDGNNSRIGITLFGCLYQRYSDSQTKKIYIKQIAV